MKMTTDKRGFLVPVKKGEEPTEVKDGECYVNESTRKTYKRISGQWVCLDDIQEPATPRPPLEPLALLALSAINLAACYALRCGATEMGPVFGALALVAFGVLVWRWL